MVDSSTSNPAMSSSEIAFPRGGSTALTPLEVKEISNEAAKDVLFSTADSGSKRSKEGGSSQPRKRSKKKLSKAVEATEEEEETDQVQIENFSFKNLMPDTLILGQIKEVGKMDITLGLGDNLVGYIPITSISEECTRMLEAYQESDESDEELDYDREDKENEIRTSSVKSQKELFNLSELFHINQWLRAKVVKPDNDKRKRIQLTIEPEVLNSSLEEEDLVPNALIQCSVKSIEDRGIVLNTGKSGYSGFISNRELKNANIEVDLVQVGLVMLASILSKPSKRNIALRPLESTSLSKKAAVSSISSIDSIQPGILVDAIVSDITKNGLVTKVFGLVDGTVNLANLHAFDLEILKHKFTVGNTTKARVMAVLAKGGTKKLILSLLPQVMSFASVPDSDMNISEAFPVGHVFDQVTVKGTDPNYLFVDIGSSTVFGQVHKSKIDADRTLSIDFTVGSSHKARVIGYNNLENLLVLTLESKIINAKYLTTNDIPNGELLTSCEIIKVLPESKGIELKLAEGFDAFVPGNQISDIRLVYPERKFKVGSKVKGRVLRKEGKRLLVTLRKSLVNIEADEVLSDFDAAKIGFKTPATVEKFVHNGAVVSFFGHIKAFLPKNEISETFVNRAEDYLKLGQSVNVKILSINKEQERLIVTLKQSTDLSESQKAGLDDLHPGKSVSHASVIEKKNESVIVELKGTQLRGVIFSGHLSDGNYEQNRAIFKKLAVGEELEVLILEKDLKARTVVLTAKESLLDAARNNAIPSFFKEIKTDNSTIHGYVKSVTSMGLFVSFAGKLTGLVLAKYASQKKDEDLSKKFYKYKSVACRVIRIDEENKRFLLSLTDDKESDGKSQGEEVIKPADVTKKYISDYFPGCVTLATVKSVKGTQINVQLAENLQGRIDLTQCFNSWAEIRNKKQPLSQFSKNQELKVKVIGYHDAKNHTFLPITHQKANKYKILELTMLKDELEHPNEPYNSLALKDIKEGSKWVAYVNNIAKGYIWVSISPNIRGRISFMEFTDDVSLFDDIDNRLPIGTAVQCVVKDISNSHNMVELISREHIVHSVKDLKVGERVPARVIKVKETYVLVQLGESVIGSSFITDALNSYSDNLSSIFHANDFATATILAVDESNNKVAVSLRDENFTDKLINTFEDVKQGDVVRGFVKNVANNGVYVSLGRSVHALVRISDLSDSFLKDWKKYFKPHQSVLGRIISCKEEGRILMTLKVSELDGDLNPMKKFDDLEVGDIFEGSVKEVTTFGVFVKLDGTLNVSGLCHHSEIADNKIEDISAIFGEGDRVKVKLLAIDKSKKQLSLGMKASYFTNELGESEVEQQSAEDNVSSNDNQENEDSDVENSDEDDVMEDAFDEADGDDETSSEEEEDEDDDDDETASTSKSGLSTNGFDWTASILDQAEDNDFSSDEEDFMRPKKSKRKSKKHDEDKTADINSRAPQSVGDFERLLVGNPNSSIVWMNYMSFQLQTGEIDKAREIGDRALKTINYRDEAEKLNIWIALLNLENTFGGEDTLEETFKRSCQYMDSFLMHQKLVGIYTMSEKYDKADQLYKSMAKKFSKHVQFWVQYGSYLLDRKLDSEVHQVLARALQALPKPTHIEIVRKFGQLEFAKGDPEQGRSLFEGLVADAAKRIDLWNVYIDQEMKLNNKDKVEDLFERVVSKKLTRKQAKFFFSKWLSFEENNGDDSGAARVRAKATEYVQRFQSDQ